MNPALHQIKATEFVMKNIFGDMFAKAKRCPKCESVLDENGECHNSCPEQEFCANLCGNHRDVGDKSKGWDDNGNEPWYCDECKDEQIDAIRSSKETDAYHAKKFRGW